MTIKRTPDDFVVEEVLTPDFLAAVRDQPAPFVLYRLTKSGLATAEAAALVAKELRVAASNVTFAGLKDKYARTTQHITVQPPRPDWADRAPPALHGPHWKLERLGWVDQPIAGPAIAVNRFRIVVRGLTRRQGEQMEEAAGLLGKGQEEEKRREKGEGRREKEEPQAGAGVSPPVSLRPSPFALLPSLLLVNYFGDQRFGSARHGQGFVAWHLLRGDFEQALRLSIAVAYSKEKREGKRVKNLIAQNWGRWADVLPKLPRCPELQAVEHLAARPDDFRGAFTKLPYLFQQLCVYAYQSHLWNAMARRLVEVGAGNPDQESTMIVADDPFGELVFPAADAIPPALAELDLPVLGRNTELVEPWKGAAEEVLAEEKIASVRDLRIPGMHRPFFGESPRRLFVDAAEFSMTDLRVDETQAERRFQRELSFALPRGAYATVVLRALGQ